MKEENCKYLLPIPSQTRNGYVDSFFSFFPFQIPVYFIFWILKIISNVRWENQKSSKDSLKLAVICLQFVLTEGIQRQALAAFSFVSCFFPQSLFLCLTRFKCTQVIWNLHTIFPKNCSVPVVLKMLCAVSGYFQRNPGDPLMIHTSHCQLKNAGLG